MILPEFDSSIRKSGEDKLAHAYHLRDALRIDMDRWWSKKPVSLGVELRDDETTIELIMRTKPLPAVDDWWNRTNDVFQNMRSALDRVHFAICQHFTAPGDPGRVYFPITKDVKGWKEWKKQHTMLPTEVLARYYEFQPEASGRPYLAALARATNLEKHADGVRASVALTDLRMDMGTMTLEGLWGEGYGRLEDVFSLTAGSTLDIVAEHQVLGTIKAPTRVLDLGTAKAEGGFTFTPMMHFDGEEIPFVAAVEHIGREVTWAIAYITGIVDSAAEPPVHFDP